MFANSLDNQKVNIGSHVGVGPTAPNRSPISILGKAPEADHQAGCGSWVEHTGACVSCLRWTSVETFVYILKPNARKCQCFVASLLSLSLSLSLSFSLSLVLLLVLVLVLVLLLWLLLLLWWWLLLFLLLLLLLQKAKSSRNSAITKHHETVYFHHQVTWNVSRGGKPFPGPVIFLGSRNPFICLGSRNHTFSPSNLRYPSLSKGNLLRNLLYNLWGKLCNFPIRYANCPI